MSLTRPIPPDADPVIDALRRDVPRPATLPRLRPASYECERMLIWDKADFKQYCPMGLHEKAVVPTPYISIDFADQAEFIDGCSNTWERVEAIQSFAQWWDEQSDAQAATDAVWPLEVNGS